MKDILLNYAAYNVWANVKMTETLKKLPDAQSDLEIISSFDSIRKTSYHLWDAESIWYQRLHLVEQTVKPSGSFQGSFADACGLWEKQSRLLQEWVEKAAPVRLEHVVAYYNSRKQYCKLTVIELLMHAFNHATYHRGQLVTMLRQAGVNKIPVTDYIEFLKGRK